MSIITLEMPSLSPTMEEGTIVKWLVKEGDYIESGTAIAEIATDKSTVEYESLDEGYIRKIIVADNTEISVGEIIAIMTEEKDSPWEKEYKKIQKEKKSHKTDKKIEEIPEKNSQKEKKKEVSKTVGIVNSIVETVIPPKDIAQPLGATKNSKRIKVSPVAKKIAEERHINLSVVKASNGERISKVDVENLPNGYGQNLADTNKGLIGYVNRASEAFTDIPMNQMRKAISARMVQASAGVPTFFLKISVSMDKLLNVRKELNETQELRISINDFIIKACALALRDFPAVNSAYQGNFIRQFNDIDISVAVSTPNGLITPIVRSADTKGLLSLNQEVKELVKKASSNTLDLNEYQGGSFTVSNLGMFGIDDFTAILNPPQVAILAIGGTKKQLSLSNNNVIEKTLMNLTLTSDHRVVDGVLAAGFMNKIKFYLENPIQLVL